jgi:hypothetical protein
MVRGPLPFQPSNISLAGIDLSMATDETIPSDWEVRNGLGDCFGHAASAKVTQSDGSEVAVFVVNSLKVDPTGHVSRSSIGGRLPIATVSLGAMTVLGQVEGHAQGVHAAPGGFESGQDQDGAGGASYCGMGGSGAAVAGSGGSAGLDVTNGMNGHLGSTPAAGGPGTPPGGRGAAGTPIEGAAAPTPGATGVAGRGGGAAGRIRLHSKSGRADVAAGTFSLATSTP